MRSVKRLASWGTTGRAPVRTSQDDNPLSPSATGRESGAGTVGQWLQNIDTEHLEDADGVVLSGAPGTPSDGTSPNGMSPVTSPNGTIRQRSGRLSASNFRSNDAESAQKQSNAAIQGYDVKQAGHVAYIVRMQLDAADPTSRAVACTALGNMGALGEPYAKEISKHLTDPEDMVKWSAAGALQILGQPGIEALVAMYKHKDPLVREAVVASLGEAKSTENVKAIVECLSDPHVAVRSAAVLALSRMGEVGNAHAYEVANLLKDTHLLELGETKNEKQTQQHAEEIELERLAEEFIIQACSDDKVTKIADGISVCQGANHALKLLNHPRHGARSIALKALASSKNNTNQMAVNVGFLVGDDNADVDSMASDFLKEACKDNATCVKLLTHEKTGARRIATESVKIMGKDAVSHAPTVMRMLVDSDPKTRCSAVIALGQMGLQQPADAAKIAAMTEDPDAAVRLGAVNSLIAIGLAGKPHAANLVALLAEEDSEVRNAAALGLRSWAGQSAADQKKVDDELKNRTAALEKEEKVQKAMQEKEAKKQLAADLKAQKAADKAQKAADKVAEKDAKKQAAADLKAQKKGGTTSGAEDNTPYQSEAEEESPYKSQADSEDGDNVEGNKTGAEDQDDNKKEEDNVAPIPSWEMFSSEALPDSEAPSAPPSSTHAQSFLRPPVLSSPSLRNQAMQREISCASASSQLASPRGPKPKKKMLLENADGNEMEAQVSAASAASFASKNWLEKQVSDASAASAPFQKKQWQFGTGL